MVKRRNFKREFKLEILRQLSTKSVAEIAKENNIHPKIIYKWKDEFEKN
ncbi:TPA: transposase, partial [Candidatus Woesearchaeota archaeon]|nr:transposase [Candidatus Woesearchaeota archaeon]